MFVNEAQVCTANLQLRTLLKDARLDEDARPARLDLRAAVTKANNESN